METHTFFDLLRRQLSDPASGNNLPDEIRIESDTAHFLDASAQLKIEYAYIRDTGPAAWGYRVSFPRNCLFSWDKGHTWYYEEAPDSRFLTVIGNSITLLYVDEKDNLHYERYIACDMDEG